MTVSKHEHVVFDTDRPDDRPAYPLLEQRPAPSRVKLRNDETGEEVVARTDFVAVDLGV